MFRRRQNIRETGHAAAPTVDAPADHNESDAGQPADEALPLRFEKGHAMASKTPTPPQRPDLPRRVVDIPGAPTAGGSAAPARRPQGAATGQTAGSASDAAGSTERKLIVGREISLNGEINACDHLVVEGRVEARLADCKTIEVADGGTFKGSAEIEEANIGGRFEGDLIVRGRLRLQGDGIVAGTVRYGELEVEAGGRIIGTLEPLESTVTPMPEPAPREPARNEHAGGGSSGWEPQREPAAAHTASDDAG